jgi:molybdate transport system ATP-binding protein
VLFDSEQHINLPAQQRHVGYLFQSYALFPNMTVEENISFAADVPKEGKGAITSQLIADFQLTGLEKKRPSQLSGGQQQRVALARLLANNRKSFFLTSRFPRWIRICAGRWSR